MNSRPLRSAQWFKTSEYYAFGRRARLRSEGFTSSIFDEGKPVIGIANSWSELNNCNLHLKSVADAVKRGVWVAGGVPLEFPTISLGEMFIKPTTMLLRNLMAMDVEEMIRTQPLDGVVRLGGCDKTTPAQIMGAGLPAIVCSGGPMLHGQWHDRKLGAGTDGRKLFDLFRKGDITGEQWCEIEGGIARSAGHCNVMGTASTMTLLAEALGLALPATAAIPAPDSRRLAAAEECGRRIVELVRDDLTPAKILTPVESAVGGPLAAVQTGDEIELDASARRLHLHVPEEEISRRLKSFQPPPPHYTRGYGRLFLDHVLQADEGWDFDFLRGI